MRKWIAVGVFVLLPLLPFVSHDGYAQENAEAGRKVVAKVIPQYPGLARSMRIQGNVRADVLVAANGKVKSVEMKGGHPLLVQSAEDALRQWKWEPTSHESHEIVELKFTP
jgi:TonB family protein